MTSTPTPRPASTPNRHRAASRRATALAAVLVAAPALGLAPAARAQPAFDFDTIQLLPNLAGQAVEFFVVNPGPDPVRFSALDLNLQVADSGPASEGGLGVLDGPNISGVDLLTHTPFEPNNTGAFDADSLLQFANWSTTTATGELELAAGDRALFATVWFDTTGFLTGDFPLSFTDTLNGPTQLFRTEGRDIIATTIAHGTGRLRIGTPLTPVPDTTPGLLLLGLSMSVLHPLRRRSRGLRPEPELPPR